MKNNLTYTDEVPRSTAVPHYTPSPQTSIRAVPALKRQISCRKWIADLTKSQDTNTLLESTAADVNEV